MNNINSEIKNIFPANCTVSALQITNYLHWAAHPDEYEYVLTMPPIQRGFVWKPKQIQELWDSLLRGMPIGSIMLKASRPNEKSRKVISGKSDLGENPKSGFHLMDGQQRTLSMLLGFPDLIEEAQHKLWVDFNESGKNGSQFQFRVSTAAQPFGHAADGSRLSLHDRREARKNWDGDDENKIEKTNREIFDDETTRPWKTGGKRQEYIFEVKNLWRCLNIGGDLTVDRWEVFKVFMHNKETELDDATFERIIKFRNALMQLQNQWIALIKIPDVKVQADLEDPRHDYLTMLFDRISSGGTRLSPDELLFSMIKQSWPDAHNIVYRLQEQVGSLMKPTDFIMTAFRLAMLQSNDSKVRSDPELNATIFHKHLAGLLDGNDETSVLRKMISLEGTLVTAFKAL